MLTFISRYPKRIAWSFICILFAELVVSPVYAVASFTPATRSLISPYVWMNHPAFKTYNDRLENTHSWEEKERYEVPTEIKRGFTTGPTQPESESFSSVNNNNLVDLFSGDFSYNIPLMDVGGYPINLGYRAGVSMDQEASWVGLGWNVNPGTVNRNMRGLPDDFNGLNDSIRKVSSIRENKTIGVSTGADLEITGAPIGIGGGMGVFHNNYKGWGLETFANVSINSGKYANGPLSGGLSITNNTQEGLTMSPSLSVNLGKKDAEDRNYGTFSMSSSYNNRAGLKALQMTAGVRQYRSTIKDQKEVGNSQGNSVSGSISFATPTFVPSITMPFTSRQFSFSAKVGTEIKVVTPTFNISGYVSRQKIEKEDTLLALPAYGYLNLQDGAKNKSALLDFNREKEIPYREKPAVPHIAIPSYTYDAFSITGEGTGGMFRAYRGDVGFVHDHFMRTKDASDRASVDISPGDLVHAGLDIMVTRSFTQNGPWLENNTIKGPFSFGESKGLYEAAYFRNPGEKAINSKKFYDNLGGDDLVAVELSQPGNSGPNIYATNYLSRYRNKRNLPSIPINAQKARKDERDKRTQVISYLNSSDAQFVALSKYIENYKVNQFNVSTCTPLDETVEGSQRGLQSEYFYTKYCSGRVVSLGLQAIDYAWPNKPVNTPSDFPADKFSIRWTGRIKAPATGNYIITVRNDDGARLWLNDSLLINDWNVHAAKDISASVNLIANEMYTIKVEYFEEKGFSEMRLKWKRPDTATTSVIPLNNLYPPAKDTFDLPYVIKEKRLNEFRKANHISEINVLNAGGKRYVYGLPVYNLKQKEATFSVDKDNANLQKGLVKYKHNEDNSTANRNDKDRYYNSEEIPAYAHSFLLTGILSSDYVDVTGNGISDDDMGDGIKFNYTKISGIKNPFKWRAPATPDSVTYNEGLKTYNRDDKGNYVYGEKELWYLHSVESKTMIATFTLESRTDLPSVDERGQFTNGISKRLKEINLYSKAEFVKNPGLARPLKTVHFEYDYSLCPRTGYDQPGGKLTLKKVWFSYNGNTKGQLNPYVFHYANNKPYQTKSFDRWGNYKEPLQNPGSTPQSLIENDEYPYSIQDSAQAAINAATWNLDSINLPSGGTMSVQYESDEYAFVQNKRAMQFCKIAGFGNNPNMMSGWSNQLYNPANGNEHLYVYIEAPNSVLNKAQVYHQYLSGISKLFFRINVNMPSDAFGQGSEKISCYADLDINNGYGFVNSNTFWVKIKGVSLKGDQDGTYSPLAKAAIQFLRMNLPSKAYPGSEGLDNIDGANAIKALAGQFSNFKDALKSFDRVARENKFATDVDLTRSFVRLNDPDYRKIGGGHRVKRIVTYDKWNKMTGQREAVYGQEYIYNTTRELQGVKKIISSGVASYEPGIGGEENPFHEPVEYIEKVSVLGPVTLGYTELPLGESFFPAPGVGYSKVRVRTIHHEKKKSANGFAETEFFTAYDYPVLTENTELTPDSKKRYKPGFANFLRINARHHLYLSQGFKIELNDMHGKLRSQAYYAETDPASPVSYTENIYRSEAISADQKKLTNTVFAIKPDGSIDSNAVIGKDVELMVDMREQVSITNGFNLNLNTDLFTLPSPIPPFFLIPSVLGLANREENIFRSAATVKLIQRYGILDSVINIDKTSKISTRDILYDSETGDVVLTRTQNEFDDFVYNFNYPSHWAYDGTGLAYKNIDLTLSNLNILDGKIVSGLNQTDTSLFVGGDEILVKGKKKTSDASGCIPNVATFPYTGRIWTVDSSVLNGGPKSIYFLDELGKPYSAYNVTIRVIRSGRKNIQAAVGSVTSLKNPMVFDTPNQQYKILLDQQTKVINTSANEFKQSWVMPAYICSTTTKTCPVGYSESPTNPLKCYRDSIIPATVFDTVTACWANYCHSTYSACGAYIFSGDFQTFSHIDNNSFWQNNLAGGSCGNVPTPEGDGSAALAAQQFAKAKGDTTQQGSMQSLKLLSPMVSYPNNDTRGPLCRSGIWLCQQADSVDYQPTGQWIGFTEVVNFPTTGTYYIGFAADNQIRIHLDNQKITERTGAITENFKIWYIYPVTVTAGNHNLRIEGLNDGDVAIMGVEIYNNTEAQIRAAQCYSACSNGLNILFSTKDVIGRTFPRYECSGDFELTDIDGQKYCVKRYEVDKITNTGPRANNGYSAGLTGNWKSSKAYTYFGDRTESNITDSTNIRHYGTFQTFRPFWNFQNGKLQAQYDTTKWVWNSEITRYNRRGFEIENRDPLGRYNAGLYGYNNTLPTAIIQNGRYRESAFEGFEDYDVDIVSCDTCSFSKHFDLSSQRSKFTTAQKHTGKYSLQVNAGQGVGITSKLSTFNADIQMPRIIYTTNSSTTCSNGIATLKSAVIDTTIKQDEFAPLPDQKMLLSAWVKEDGICTTGLYTKNRITLQFQGSSTTYVFNPAGAIVEGWQRYEAVFQIPANATDITVSMEATGNVNAYFDDLRIHPYFANMKTFVFHPITMRMMAELDENNYATFYEYDDDGTLIRLKKETQKGIKTIKETRSALLKQ